MFFEMYTSFYFHSGWPYRANVRNICKIFEVVPIEVHLLSEGISNKISKNFEVTFVPDKEMGVYEHKIQYIAKNALNQNILPPDVFFFRAIDFPRLEGIMHPTISYHSGSH